ncbi:MAG: GntR family transcriptional regulator [Trueperaceae bacterium]|nr:GntR family transcriptional regulator [Trueperaceae bacterium]
MTDDRHTAPSSLTGVDTRPLRQQIADALQAAILGGEFKPGAALVETDIAARLGVSRAPVREALQLLASSHLVETIPYRGTTVRRLTAADVEEVYSLRTLLETFALRRAMACDAGETGRVLRACCDAMAASAAAGDWSRLSMEDERFHEGLIEMADHGLLRHAWRDLNMRVRQIMALRNLQNDDTMTIVYNHLPIVDAVEAGDVERAVRGLEQHIATAADLVAVLDGEESGSTDPGPLPAAG